MDFILGLSSILMVNFMGPSEYTEFKKVEYDISKTYGKEVYTKCDIPLSAVAYAFAMKESGNGKGHKQANKNNLFGLRHGKSNTVARPKFAKYPVKTYTPNGYNVYNSRYDAIYDFMNQFYTRGCKLTKGYVKGHLNGANGGWGGVDSYYSTIIAQSNKFLKSDINVRVMYKPSSILEMYSITETLDGNGYKRIGFILPGYNIISDSRTQTYYMKVR